ncbi:MAG: hypothetical protein AABY22_00730, partial [Nanoarchaeota archaeon]
MLGSSAGIAAAANYPNPFVTGGVADVAIVYGSNTAAAVDLVGVAKISTNLQSKLGTGTTSTTTTVTGSAKELFGGTKLYVNDSLNTVVSSVSGGDLKPVLDDQTFSGNVDSKTTFTLQIGSNPILTYAKLPTNDYDPQYGYSLSTNAQTAYLYNASISFNKAVNFSHADSEGEQIILFGQKFTVATETDNEKIVLLKAAETAFLSSDANPSQEVTISGKTYTVELVAATDLSATIKVTDSTGKSEQKEISEAASKKVNGLTIAVNNADESTALNKLTAEIIAGAEKVNLDDGNAVTVGEDAKQVDGTYVSFVNTNAPGNITQIRVSIAAKNSDSDAITPGMSFTDPVFSTFKIDFSGLNIPENSTDREDIMVKHSGDDKMTVVFTDHKSGNAKTIQFAKNNTAMKDIAMQRDESGHNITVMERTPMYRDDYVVVGNENKGYLLRISQVT